MGYVELNFTVDYLTLSRFQDNAYKISTRSQIGLNIQRGFQRLRNQYVPPVSGIIANTIISVVVGSVYYNLSEDTDAMDKRAVLLFFSLMINAYAPAFDVSRTSLV